MASMPAAVEGAGIAGLLPVAVGEADGVAERVELPLALADSVLDVGLVLEAPGERRRVEVGHEGIGVGVDEEAASLAADDPFEEIAQRAVVLRERKVGPDLRRGVAQPHGGMSPVRTAVSGLPSKVPGWTVVSRVLGKQLMKRRAKLGVGDTGAALLEEGFDGGAPKPALRRLGAAL